jgi:hypothetical protein
MSERAAAWHTDEKRAHIDRQDETYESDSPDPFQKNLFPIM